MVSKTVSFLLIVAISTSLAGFSIKDLYDHSKHLHWGVNGLAAILLIAIVYFLRKPQPIYLVDFSCYKPEDGCKAPKQTYLERASASGYFTEESMVFQKKVMEKSGLGEETYIPKAFLRDPFDPRLIDAREEVETLMFGALDELFAKTDLNPREIGILIINCSLFSPTPSLSAMVVNRYKLRSNIMSYNLAGMGCSAGVISVDLAKNLLQVRKNSYALVVSVECGTLNSYTGNQKSMLVANCLFRLGAATMLLSNKRSDRRRSKYQLVHTVRTHRGADDKAFNCVVQKEDPVGKIGIALSKELMIVAGDALKANVTTLGPLVLPVTQQLRFIVPVIANKVFSSMKLKPFIPDFKLAFEHFCIHAGGSAVLDAVQKNLQLTEGLTEPSRMTLYRFGNTSSSSVWYELAYSEAKGRVKKGDRIWQISFGSGFKCNSAVWKALRTVNPDREKNPWMDEINSFPVHIPKL